MYLPFRFDYIEGAIVNVWLGEFLRFIGRKGLKSLATKCILCLQKEFIKKRMKQCNTPWHGLVDLSVVSSLCYIFFEG